MKKKVVGILLCSVLCASLAACNSSDSSEKEINDEEVSEEKEEDGEEIDDETDGEIDVEIDDEADDESDGEADDEADNEAANDAQWDAGDLAYLGLDRDQILEIYDYYMDLLEDPAAWDLTGDDITKYENECTEKTAEKYGITTDDVDNIFFASLDSNFFSTFDIDSVKISHGELKDIVVTGDEVTVSAKITSSMSNKNAIEQCYYDACDFIRDYAGTDYDEVTFAGYADFQDGSEMKFIQFTIPKNIIETIANGKFADNTLGDYVEDLWIIESMR